MGGAIFQKEGVKVPVTANKVKITISAQRIIQKMTLKVKTIISQ
jgi:hypothetical protein